MAALRAYAITGQIILVSGNAQGKGTYGSQVGRPKEDVYRSEKIAGIAGMKARSMQQTLKTCVKSNGHKGKAHNDGKGGKGGQKIS